MYQWPRSPEFTNIDSLFGCRQFSHAFSSDRVQEVEALSLGSLQAILDQRKVSWKGIERKELIYRILASDWANPMPDHKRPPSPSMNFNQSANNITNIINHNAPSLPTAQVYIRRRKTALEFRSVWDGLRRFWPGRWAGPKKVASALLDSVQQLRLSHVAPCLLLLCGPSVVVWLVKASPVLVKGLVQVAPNILSGSMQLVGFHVQLLLRTATCISGIVKPLLPVLFHASWLVAGATAQLAGAVGLAEPSPPSPPA
jgi:hypothetical protein